MLQVYAQSKMMIRQETNIHWKDWYRSWNSNTLATWCKELTHWKRPWCWERLKAGGEGDDRAWDGWMASLTQWTWVWASSRSWWWTGKPGTLQSMGPQRVGHDWATTHVHAHTHTHQSYNSLTSQGPCREASEGKNIIRLWETELGWYWVTVLGVQAIYFSLVFKRITNFSSEFHIFSFFSCKDYFRITSSKSSKLSPYLIRSLEAS